MFYRKALRRIGLTRPTDLLAVDWAGMAARAGRFVELDVPRYRDSASLGWLRSVPLMMGFSALRHMARMRTARGRRWLRSRLVDMPLQEDLERAFAALSPQEPAAWVGARG